jgi:single-stranded DNA-binding protein
MFNFTITARLLKDPECKNPTQEKPIVELFIGDTNTKKDELTGYRKGTTINVTIFGSQAEFALLHLKKGDQVTIIGDIVEDQWQDKITGADKKALKFYARQIDKFWPPRQAESAKYDDEIASF